MSTSPPPVVGSAIKRPLEDPSSPNGPTDQPDAKRPALDKAKDEPADGAIAAEEITVAQPVKAEEVPTEAVKPDVKDDNADTQPTSKDAHGDTVVPDAPSTSAAILQTQPIQSTAGAHGRSSNQNQHQDESNWLHLRAVITTTEAATIIGKGGENVTAIRNLSGAKCTVSDYQRGAVERILTVSGLVDAVSKAFGLIVRTLNQEPLDATSTSTSKSYPMRLLIPNILIGSIIGKGGQRIREIQDASNARLNASESNLPLSGERSLVVLGVADAVHIAVYYVAQTLVEQLSERWGGPSASNYASRRGDQPNIMTGGLVVQPYVPQPAGGQWGHPNNFRRHNDQAVRTPANPYGIGYLHSQAPQPPQQPMAAYGASPARAGYGATPVQPTPYPAHQPAQAVHGGGHVAPTHGGAQPGGMLTQQIYIPNDMVGAIIGKGGQKINEIRQLSGSVIKINEPQDNSNERLVTITGTQECNSMALYMLYQRLENEKHRM